MWIMGLDRIICICYSVVITIGGIKMIVMFVTMIVLIVFFVLYFLSGLISSLTGFTDFQNMIAVLLILFLFATLIQKKPREPIKRKLERRMK